MSETTTSSGEPELQQAKPTWPQAPTVAPELERLKSWAGGWSAKETYEPSEFVPKGGTGTGSGVIRVGPGGMLLEDYESKGAPFGPFTAHHVLTFDADKRRYLSFWFDSMLPKGMISEGTFEKDDLVVIGESVRPDGKKGTYRGTYSKITADSRLFTMEESVEGGPFKKMFTIRYEKATTAH